MPTQLSTLQTFGVQFQVSDRLDGQTAAAVGPLFQTRPLPGQFYGPDEPLERLGVIDLSWDKPDPDKADPVSPGPRYIPWLSVIGGLQDPDAAASSGFYLNRGDGTPEIFEQFQSLAVGPGAFVLYTRKGFCVPAGMSLVLDGVQAAANLPVLVRFGVLLPRSNEEESLIRQAFCCTEDLPTVVQLFPEETTGCEDPVITESVLQRVGFPDTPFTLPIPAVPAGIEVPFAATDRIVIFGDNITADTQLLLPDAIDFAVPGLPTFEAPNGIAFRLSTVGADPGTYQAILRNEADGETCDTVFDLIIVEGG